MRLATTEPFGARTHRPVIVRLESGAWGTFCYSCSAREGDYVPVCLLWTPADAPPPVLVDPDEVTQLLATIEQAITDPAMGSAPR